MMTTKTILFTAIAAMALTACGQNNFDINDFAVRSGPQSQSPIADAPGGKLPDGGAATLVIIDEVADVTNARQTSSANMSVAAFRDICLLHAPSFAGSAAAAAQYGITDVIDVGFMAMGSTADTNLAVQIQAGKECVITTPTQGTNPVAAFAAIIPGATSTSFPMVANAGGAPFIFQHDRQGGEAFVMLKR